MVGWFMVFNATVNNIVIIMWLLVLLMEETGEKITDLSQVTDKLYHKVIHSLYHFIYMIQMKILLPLNKTSPHTATYNFCRQQYVSKHIPLWQSSCYL